MGVFLSFADPKFLLISLLVIKTFPVRGNKYHHPKGLVILCFFHYRTQFVGPLTNSGFLRTIPPMLTSIRHTSMQLNLIKVWFGVEAGA